MVLLRLFSSAKAKKYFLVIDAGVDQAARAMPQALGCAGDGVEGGGGQRNGQVRCDRRKGSTGHVSYSIKWVDIACQVIPSNCLYYDVCVRHP